MLAVAVLMGLSLTACDSDDLNTDQYGGGVQVQAFGPCPVLRGGTLFFYGSNLDQISEIDLPGADPITAIEVIERGGHSKISIQVPAEKCDTGIVVLKTMKGGELRTLSPVTYREDIKLTGFYVGSEGNLSGKAGDELTIKGDYLNLMHGVIFAENDTVSEDDFLSRDRYTIVVRIPETARTGAIKITDLADEPSELESEEALEVQTPTVESLSPAKPKAGQSVTVKGAMLNQVESISLQGATVSEFSSQRSDQIVFLLPAEATDGEVMLVLKSGVEVPAGSIETVVPANLKAVPSPVKNGATLTITGNDLDLITSVQFANADDAAKVTAQSVSELKVTVPETAQSGDIALSLANGKQVKVACEVKKPTITAVAPASLMAGEQLVIRGTDLDLVASITFPADQTVAAKDMRVTSQAIVLNVPSGAAGTGFTLNLKNGTAVENTTLVVRPSTDPTLTNAPAGNPGKEVTIEGANYNSVEAIYIGSVKVTKIVSRSDSKMTFVIPSAVEAGEYDLILTTSDGGSYTVGKLTVVPNEIDVTANCLTQDQSGPMTFPVAMTWDDSGRFRIMRKGAVDLSKYTFTAGKSKIKFYTNGVYGDDPKIQFNDYGWNDRFGYPAPDRATNLIEVTLTQDMVDCITGAQSDGWSQTAFLIQGQDMTITKVMLVP